MARTVSRPTAVVRRTATLGEVTKVLSGAFAELATALEAQRVPVAGRPFARYRLLDARTLDVEAGVPVERPVAPTGHVRGGIQPDPRSSGMVTLRLPPWETMESSLAAIERWAARYASTRPRPSAAEPRREGRAVTGPRG